MASLSEAKVNSLLVSKSPAWKGGDLYYNTLLLVGIILAFSDSLGVLMAQAERHCWLYSHGPEIHSARSVMSKRFQCPVLHLSWRTGRLDRLSGAVG
jgi:hypothetical protein